VKADTLTEDFESYNLLGFNPDTKPDLNWYNYFEGGDFGNLTDEDPIAGTQSFRMNHGNTTDISNIRSQFRLEVPTQVSKVDFKIDAGTIDENGFGTNQFIALESSAPVRSIVVFYVFCNNSTYENGCEFRVKFDALNTTGAILIDASNMDDAFNVEVSMDWIDAEFCLEVDAIDDGCFPMLEIPENFYRIRMGQYRADIPFNLTFDDWIVYDGVNATADAVLGDAATGIQNFANQIHFTTTTSLFIFGLILFIVLVAAVIIPMFSLGKSNSIAPAASFYTILVALWLVSMEFWPDWVGITGIILASSLIGLILRRVFLGIRDANNDASIVIGSLGYFIISSTFLGFSGYATDTIQTPTGSPDQQPNVNETAEEQTFFGAVAECVLTGGVFTFGLRGDCSQKTISKTWTKITDVFGWIQTGINFLFQLLTFRLPIPVIFNMMIVLPPATGLAYVAMKAIRG
jgi:hypothetical protein